MQNKITKGSFVLVIACVLLSLTSSAYGILSDNIHTPFVLNANKVPVVGGALSIYGFNFGADPSVIRVYVVDTNTGHTIPCVDVAMILPNSIISCTIVDVGTGKDKRIEVNVNGVSNAFTEDNNTVFSRTEPIMEILSYDDEGSIIHIHGSNFGEDTSLVSVSVDGFDHLVTFVNDSTIICNKHVDYQLPASSAYVSTVSVTVDEQQSIANLTFVSINDALLAVSKPEELATADPAAEIKPRDNRLIIIGLIAGGVGAVLAIAGFFIVKNRQLNIAKAQQQKSTDSKIEIGTVKDAIAAASAQQGGAIVLQRDRSFEEIDLNDDLLVSRNNSFYEPKIEYDYSSSSSSFSSPYSSTNASPFTASPGSMRRAEEEFSTSTSTHSHKKSKIDYETVHTPNSRLSKKSLDSPYFSKQNPFDSPLGSSTQSLTPQHPSLNSSQEINANACVFDSPSVLHTVMARAAMLRTREQQPKQQQEQQQQPSPSRSPSVGKPPLYNVERRASLSGPLNAPLGRRRTSLGISSLHLSALHSSYGITRQKQQYQQQQQQQQQRNVPLNATQVIEIPDSE